LRHAATAALLAMLAAMPASSQETLDDVIRRLMEQATTDPAPQQTERRSAVILRGLDTFSGQVERFTVPVGRETNYARLRIRALTCLAVDDSSDAYAFLEIVDTKTPDALAFRGWMIASSPALSALEHPRYDVWVESCSTDSAEAP
jgi:hypothetical protein